jgi:hypothetical protein
MVCHDCHVEMIRTWDEALGCIFKCPCCLAEKVVYFDHNPIRVDGSNV